MAESYSFLESILPKSVPYKIENVSSVGESDGEEEESFSAVVRLKIKSGAEVATWKEAFEQSSHSNWIVNLTFPHQQRYQFKKDYICRRSRKNKLASDNDQRHELIKLNANCHAKLSFRIKKDTVNIRKQDKFVRDGRSIINYSLYT